MDDARRRPGEFLFSKLMARNVWLAMATFVAAGFAFGVVVVPQLGQTWSMVLAALMAAGLFAIWFRYRRSEWSDDNLDKGSRGERRVGETIEQAIAAHGCAVAHNVKEIAAVGDIDHLVATPERVWVVETKYRWVPKDEFSKTIDRIDKNVAAVEREFPGVPVQGSLVLAYEDEKDVKRRRYNDGRVLAHKPDSLAETLRCESRRKPSLDPAVADRIWDLAAMRESG